MPVTYNNRNHLAYVLNTIFIPLMILYLTSRFIKVSNLDFNVNNKNHDIT